MMSSLRHRWKKKEANLVKVMRLRALLRKRDLRVPKKFQKKISLVLKHAQSLLKPSLLFQSFHQYLKKSGKKLVAPRKAKRRWIPTKVKQKNLPISSNQTLRLP